MPGVIAAGANTHVPFGNSNSSGSFTIEGRDVPAGGKLATRRRSGEQRFFPGDACAAIFAAIAMLLAAVGIYGVISQSVTQRTQEIGIRMALGAGSTTVLGMVIRQGLALIGIGLTQAMMKILFGVKPTDVTTYAGVVAIYLPARRATRI